MPKEKKEKNSFQKIFISGLLILIPIVATLFVLMFLFNFLDSWLSPHGAEILRALGVNLPPDWHKLPGFGIAATFLLILATGLFASNYLGRRLLKLVDHFMSSLPVLNHVYHGMRQLIDAFSASKGTAFKTVVMLEFPQPGIWTLGFIAAPAAAWATRVVKRDMVNVFIPAAPLPSTGILVMVPRNKVKVLPLAVEEAFKIVATMGLVTGKESAVAPASSLPDLPASKRRKKS